MHGHSDAAAVRLLSPKCGNFRIKESPNAAHDCCIAAVVSIGGNRSPDLPGTDASARADRDITVLERTWSSRSKDCESLWYRRAEVTSRNGLQQSFLYISLYFTRRKVVSDDKIWIEEHDGDFRF